MLTPATESLGFGKQSPRHSTQHTFATDLIMNGADPRTVQTLLGHKTLNMTMKIYAKTFMEQRRTAVAKLSYGGGDMAPDTVPGVACDV